MRAQVGRAASAFRSNLTWPQMIEQGYVIAGSPATVRDMLREAIVNLRVGQLMLLMQFGDMPKELALHNTELFAREVMPHLKGMWSEYEDHWFPTPLARRARPAPIAAK
jgi:alkanesulfonate monooxygenase SsuD/methylene tetrahydromethanopterin reductase-like flavin-dependent oxidoreductase (luciferase family)